MPLPSGPPPWFGLDADTLRSLEIHQTRAVAIPGRGWRDLAHSVILFSAADSEPFFNRLTAVRWPSHEAGFEACLAEVLELFEALDRRPYIWIVPGLSTPPDIVERLEARGFADLGGGHDMLLVRDGAPPESELPPGVVLHRWHEGADAAELAVRAEGVAQVVAEAFHVPPERRHGLALEVGLTMTSPDFHAYLVTVDGVPAATGQRYSFDGASYLSSIGTRPQFRRRGFGEIVTAALARDSLADGCDLVYLGVHADNAAAIRLYERLGFAILGRRSSDMLLRRRRGR